MGLDISKRDGITIAVLNGDIDGKTAPGIQEQVLPLATEDCKLILDMGQVEYMSSAGLRMLLSVRRQVPASGRVILVGLSEAIKDTMAITGFIDFFTSCETLNEGIAALK